MHVRLLCSLLASIACALPAAAQTNGAVNALNRFGEHVEGNAFPRKDGVYLSGGPRESCGEPGLADGVYCFQITDPAGTVLLTRDPIGERTVRVVGGVIGEYLGTTRASGAKAPCGALNLRLVPFATTPFASGEYKIWFTRVEDFDPQGSQLFGFDPARSKSDNFRIDPLLPQSIVRGETYFDHDENGAWDPLADPLDAALGGWRVELVRDGVVEGVTFTDQDGRYLFLRDRTGEVLQIREESPNGFVNEGTAGATWVATTPITGTAIASSEFVEGPDFGNVRYELSPGAGRPVSFWSEQNGPGKDVLEGCDPEWRNALNTYDGLPVNLRNPVSNDHPNPSIFTLRLPPQSFDGAFANWKSFANKTPHDHAGFLLSREVAGTLLNTSCGFMQGSLLIDRFQDGVLVSLDTMLAGAIGLLSQVGAGLTGPNDPYQDLRMMMQMCTNEFGTINNTGDPSAPQVVYTRSTGPGFFESPY